MIIYEITAVVADNLIGTYEKYMREKHIPDLLATNYFRGARFTRSNENRYRIQYEAHDGAALDKYFETEAEKLRADFILHFPEGISLSRENWEVLQIWD